MLNILFAALNEKWEEYEAPLSEALRDAGVEAKLANDLPAEDVDYIDYAPNSPVQDFTPFTR